MFLSRKLYQSENVLLPYLGEILKEQFHRYHR